MKNKNFVFYFVFNESFLSKVYFGEPLIKQNRSTVCESGRNGSPKHSDEQVSRDLCTVHYENFKTSPRRLKGNHRVKY